MMYIPEDVTYILNMLASYGHHSYVVGGCVRDFLLNKNPNDYDIATPAMPEDVMKIFNSHEVLPTGLQHGTVTVVINHKPYEITTFRYDGDYSDNRRPDSVEFTNDIVEDLKRRDFTMNAIAYNPHNGFVDPFNGAEDIENKIIRCVGSPSVRFHEDGLRILRAMRFAAQLGFDIEDNTSLAMRNSKHLLDNMSAERVQGELVKILKSKCCGNKVMKKYVDIMCCIIPEIEPMIDFNQNSSYQIYDLWEHTLRCMDYFFLDYGYDDEDDIVTRLAVLFHDIGKPQCDSKDEYGFSTFYNHADISAKIAYDVLRRLRFSNDIVNDVSQLVSYHMTHLLTNNKADVKMLLNKIGEKQTRRLIFIRICNFVSGTRLYFNQNRMLCAVQCANNELNEIIKNNECYNLKQLAVNGDDLMEHGVPEGKDIKIILDALLSDVIEEKLENNKETLLKEVDRIVTMYYVNC